MSRNLICVMSAVLLVLALPVTAQDKDFPPAPIVNDEGGPVVITGEVEYTNPLFTSGVAQPLVILEDQAGFVDRNEYFIMPVESQTLGQITSDFYQSPFTYTLALPIEPRGAYRDVDNDDVADTGVQIFAVAYWNNTFGDPYLEERDLYGGGWSTAYASTRVSTDADTAREITGGKFVVYAPDDQQGFPADFGPDGFLFTGDEPIVLLPQGYTIVDMDTSPFTFDRSREVVIDLIEPDISARVDFGDLGYAEAFDEMIDKMRREYAFTEYKNIDWDALAEEFRPRFEEAEATRSTLNYRRALRDFLFRIPDGHISGPLVIEDIQAAFGEAIGLVIREVDDGRVLVTGIIDNGPTQRAGIEIGAEITAINGAEIDDYLDTIVPPFAPFSTDHSRRLEQLRWGVRFPPGSRVEISYINPGQNEAATANMRTVFEWESYEAAALNPPYTGFETPVEYQLLPSGFAYVKIYGFSDNSLLTVQLWERLIQTLNRQGTPGLIIDMRQNTGGSGFLANQMTAYFFDEPLSLGNTAYYDRERDEFYSDERYTQRMYLPPEDLRYHGPVAVITGPNCYSACEFFTYNMTLEDRTAVVGYYPTGGLGGSINDFFMPEGVRVRFTVGRAMNMDGEIHIEGIGVVPTLRVPVTEEILFASGDPLLETAIMYLAGQR